MRSRASKMLETNRGSNDIPSDTNNTTTPITTNISNINLINDHYNPSVRLLQIPKIDSNGSCGFHLSRSKWDPYPWVSAVDNNTPAEVTGLKAGDCVLEVNGEDVLGLRISEVANLVREKADNVSLLVWSTGMEPSCDPESLCCGPMPLNLERLSASMQTILSALECPVCMDTIPPPVIQCQNGHLLCAKCRLRAERCPVCREKYSPGRSLIAEQIYNSVTDAFNLRQVSDRKLREKLFGAKCKRFPNKPIVDINKGVQSHTNKFLAKIMGKATSLDNLSCKKDVNRLEVNEIIITKHLSLSTNDISKQDTITSIAIPRCPSVNRLNPDGGMTQNGQVTTKRPMSLNTSRECIAELVNADASLSIPVPKRMEEKIFYCPASDNCGKKFNATILHHHVKVHHNTPIICFGSSWAAISIPPMAPIEDASLILMLDNKQFWLKLRIDDNGSIFTSALLQGFEDESSLYMLEVKIRNQEEDKLLQRELITRSIVYSLTRTSWNDVLERRLGVFYDSCSIKATFGKLSELLLRVNVKYRNE